MQLVHRIVPMLHWALIYCIGTPRLAIYGQYPSTTVVKQCLDFREQTLHTPASLEVGCMVSIRLQ